MATLIEEVARVAISEVVSSGNEGKGVDLPSDRYEDAKYYAKEAFDIMDAQLPDLDPREDPPLSRSKRAAIIYVKTQLFGQRASVSETFSVAVNLYARSAIQRIRQIKKNNDQLVDDNSRTDMFK